MSEHLTHGWEPDLPPEDSLIRRYLCATTDVSAFMTRAVDGRVTRWDDVFAADPASAILFDNLAVLLQPSTLCDIDEVVTRLLDFFPPERHFCLLSAWPIPDLSDRLELMGHPPFMLRPAGGSPPPLPDGLRIQPVRTEDDLRVFVDTLVTGYPLPEARAAPLVTAAMLDGPVRMFVGYLEDQPVGTAGARLGHGLVDVEWVSTMPQARGRGVGAALTWAATACSPGDDAALIASDAGQPIYQALGYLRLQRFTVWHRPPTA